MKVALEVFRLVSNFSVYAWLVWSIKLAIMSALQTFMLVVDHDKEEAKRIADAVAQGKSPQKHPAFAHPVDDS